MIKRQLQKVIEANLFKGKIIVIYGARQVGKTTLAKQILESVPNSSYINSELLQNKAALETTNVQQLKSFLGNHRLIVIDEAQQISKIGLKLKILIDTFPDMQIIATGSSSFELKEKVFEPLTGRSRIYHLYPLSAAELIQHSNIMNVNANLENILRFGLYPEVYENTESEAVEELNNITSNYLYKDILQFGDLRRSDLVYNLLRALALQIGNEVSYNELANKLGENVATIKRYIELLEKVFVIFRLSSYSNNLRKEIAKGKKIYFYDLGIRNTIIQNYNQLNLRNDVGALWENFCITERLKINHYSRRFVNSYFWRTYDQKEIDYIEEYSGKLDAFEFKYSQTKKIKPPKAFLEKYSNSSYRVINQESVWDFIQ